MTRCGRNGFWNGGLPYRRMLLCAGDTGFRRPKTYDLEVWLPGQGMYREISSCSNTRAFPGARMNARYRGADGKPAFCAYVERLRRGVGRALIAVLENYQNADGSVTVRRCCCLIWVGWRSIFARFKQAVAFLNKKLRKKNFF